MTNEARAVLAPPAVEPANGSSSAHGGPMLRISAHPSRPVAARSHGLRYRRGLASSLETRPRRLTPGAGAFPKGAA